MGFTNIANVLLSPHVIPVQLGEWVGLWGVAPLVPTAAVVVW